jgi:hypothetical protein
MIAIGCTHAHETSPLVLPLTTTAFAASHLSTYSNTALPFTGDVTLGADKITFGNGKSVAVKKIALGTI